MCNFCLYYGLNVCVPLTHNVHVEILISNVMVLWGEAFERWVGNENKIFMNGIRTFVRSLKVTFLIPSVMWGYNEKMTIIEEAGSDQELNLSAS